MSKLSDHDKAVLSCVFNPNLPLEEAINEQRENLEDAEKLTAEEESTKQMEIRAVQLAEAGRLDEGLELINKAIQIAPKRPSLYNNRAHIYQYLRKFEDAFNDLTTAIDLSNEHHKKTLSQAHCQRGILHKRADRMELAKVDFEIASKLGNHFAKSQLVEMNPYAALCNRMLRQVMETLK
ncbi:tetratricopeptide repeat protein 36 homolog [Aethina tumida]|uniref:tetratricopeptide repeat protein 36 homolog n=1 Tax=Aethina tumida TaxID=116153 RepID=UPI00096B5302|nr:tetratricopeptide repeat protein 36 homolog [Aethina tumida]